MLGGLDLVCYMAQGASSGLILHFGSFALLNVILMCDRRLSSVDEASSQGESLWTCGPKKLSALKFQVKIRDESDIRISRSNYCSRHRCGEVHHVSS